MSLLDDLAGELGVDPGALRSAILTGGESEALTPTYLTTDAQGKVNADFSGHVHAHGLDLDAAIVTTPPTEDRIRWIRQSDGALAADLSTYRWISGGGFGETAQIRMAATLGENAGGNRQEAAFQSTVFGGVGGAAPVTAAAYVDCTDDDTEHSALILDSNGKSDFLGSQVLVANDVGADTINGIGANVEAGWIGISGGVVPKTSRFLVAFFGIMYSSANGGGNVRVYHTINGGISWTRDFDVYHNQLSNQYKFVYAVGQFDVAPVASQYRFAVNYLSTNNPGNWWSKGGTLLVLGG